MEETDALVFMTRVTEQAENYEDMFSFIKDLLQSKKSHSQDFTIEERNLISTSFKNSIENDRKSMRIIRAVMANPKFEKYSTQITAFMERVKSNITG